MPAAITRAARGACTRSTRRPARSRGSLPGSQDRGRSSPRSARRLAARHVDAGTTDRIADQRRRDLDVGTRSTRQPRTLVCAGRQSGARLTRSACGRGTTSTRAPLSCSTPRPAPTSPFQARAQGLARLGRLQSARLDQHERRQAAHGGGAEGWAPLWLRSCRQRLLYRVPVTTDRQCRGAFRDRQGRPFLPGLRGRRRMEQPSL